MTDTLLIETLKKLLATYGLILVKDDRRLERLLLEYCDSEKKKINALITAIRFGIVDTLVSAPAKQINSAYLADLAKSLHEDTGIPKVLTDWAVTTWADALRIVVPQPETYQNAVQPHLNPSTTPSNQQDNLILRLDEDLSIQLVRIPSDEFLMGSSDKDREAFDIEKPQHSVPLPDFLIARYPATNAQFGLFRKMNKKVTPYTHQTMDHRNHPVTGICWDDAIEFCYWLGKQTGKSVRLPSEAEWEKAARGTSAFRWPWGNQLPDRTLCNSDGLIGDTTPVGTYSPHGDSPYGCADMSGNVWEWTNSILQEYPYNPNDGREDLNSREDRVLRGGSHHYNSLFARCAVRVGGSPDLKSRYFGFRIALSIS